MATARWSHSATLLSSGRVLVAGGITGGAPLAGAELYDPTSNTWAATGSMHVARASQTATSLGSGATVLVAGGDDNTQALSSCEVYSTTAGTWTTTAAMSGTRDYHNAWALDSTHVLVAGGRELGCSHVERARQLGDLHLHHGQVGRHRFAQPGAGLRFLHLPELRVDSADRRRRQRHLRPGQLRDVRHADRDLGGHARSSDHRPRERRHHTTSTGATIFGGTDYNGAPLASTETLAILGLAWTSNTSMTTARGLAAIATTSTGPLIIGGGSTNVASLATTEQYNSGLTTVTAGPVLTRARWGHTATALSNGHVLVAGGLDPSTNLSLTSAELL